MLVELLRCTLAFLSIVLLLLMPPIAVEDACVKSDSLKMTIVIISISLFAAIRFLRRFITPSLLFSRFLLAIVDSREANIF